MWTKPSGNKIQYVERYEDPMTGKQKFVSVTYPKDTARNRKEALQILTAKIERKLSAAPKKSHTLKSLTEAYLDYQKYVVTASTLKRNTFALNAFSRVVGADVLADRLDSGYIKKKLVETKRGAVTCNGWLRRFRSMWRWAYENNHVESLDLLEKLKYFEEKVTYKQRISDKYLESHELKELIATSTSEHWCLLAEFMALSGLRSGEALALLKSDVDLKESVIHVRITYDSQNKCTNPAKTVNSMDDVTIQPQLEDCIKRIKKYMLQLEMATGVRSDLFFHDGAGDHLQLPAFNKWLRENAKRVSGKALTSHSLRHTHASLLFEQGVSLDAVSRRLRHGDSKITREIYLHITEKLKEKDAERLKNVVLF